MRHSFVTKRTTHLISRVLLASACLLVLVTSACRFGGAASDYTSKDELPLVKMEGKSAEVTAFQYLGSWFLPAKISKKGNYSWRDTARVSFDESRENFKIEFDASWLRGADGRRLATGGETAYFKKIQWQDNQMSLFAFRVLSPMKQVIVAEIDTDNSIALYINDKFVREVSGANNVELGTNLLIPVNLETGENIFVIKVLSNAGPPRLRMSLIPDQSKDFQAAWSSSSGFLSKLVYNKTEDSYETPLVRWNPLLDRMVIGAEVTDTLSGLVVLKRESLKNRNMIRDNGKNLGEGVYKISYKSYHSQENEAEEYFIVGSPREVTKTVIETLDQLQWAADERLNIESQTRRADILLAKNNYDPENKEWQEKIAWTVGNLANCARLKSKTDGNIFRGLPGLQFRGFISEVDNSKQFYRLFVPPNHAEGEKLPLLLILPTTIAATERSFLESPPVAAQRKAAQVCRFAEKFGFAVLWPGYPNAQEGWTRESVHAEEALEDVEKNYNIDASRISLYGICSAGFYAARLASIYPNRYAAIVYDRAIFERDVESVDGVANSIKEWFHAINPSNRIIENRNLKILVLNDGTTIEGHGEMQLTNKFLKKALAQRADIKYALEQRRIGVALWDSIFEFLAGCKNAHPDHEKADVPAKSGYAGPISEVFATPFIVVEGTSTDKEGARFMGLVMGNLKKLYREQFYGAELPCKKDIEITEDEIEKYSLVLVGNAGSNIIWSKLASRYPDGLTLYNPPKNPAQNPFKKAFAEVFKNPANKTNYLLLIGAEKLPNMTSLTDFDPFKAWFDCYIYRNFGFFPLLCG